MYLDVTERHGLGQARPIPTREELLKSIISEFMRYKGKELKLFAQLEDLSIEKLKHLRVAGTVLEPVERVLAAAGLPTDGTVRALMQEPLALTRTDLHLVSCSCMQNKEASVDGWCMALVFRGRFFSAK